MTSREARKGYPYARARQMGGGTLLCFAYYPDRAACEAAIRDLPPGLCVQFVVYIPHLEKEPDACPSPTK